MEVIDRRLIGEYNSVEIRKRISLTFIVILWTLFSFAWILIYKFRLLKISEIFPGANVLGDIFYNVFLSIITSSVFYFIVVYFPTKRKKELIQKVVSRRIGKFNLDYMLIKQDLYSLINQTPPKDLPYTFNDIATLCQDTKLSGRPPHINNNPEYVPDTWFDYFDYYFALEKHNVEGLSRYWEEIPSEVKVLIDELEFNTLKSGLENFRQTGISDKLADLAGPIYNHLFLLRKIVVTFEREWLT